MNAELQAMFEATSIPVNTPRAIQDARTQSRTVTAAGFANVRSNEPYFTPRGRIPGNVTNIFPHQTVTLESMKPDLVDHEIYESASSATRFPPGQLAKTNALDVSQAIDATGINSALTEASGMSTLGLVLLTAVVVVGVIAVVEFSR